MRDDDPFATFWQSEPPRLTPETRLAELKLSNPAEGSPAIVAPAVAGVDLAAWLEAERKLTEPWLDQHGALLFRGFAHPPSIDAFRRMSGAAITQPVEYTDRSSPRTVVAGSIYTSTDYPADYDIGLHSELSYSNAWPQRLAFFCVRPAQERGATTLADTRRILAGLRPQTRNKFASLGVRYTRRLSPQLGLSWQEVFGKQERPDVEAHCRAQNIDFSWDAHDTLVIDWHRPAICRHPRTREEVWFNHALFFNAASLDAEMSRALGSGTAAPFDTRFGDGSAIPRETLDEIAGSCQMAKLVFRWEPGDLLLVDNLLIAHGRESYRGPRVILVAMGTA